MKEAMKVRRKVRGEKHLGPETSIQQGTSEKQIKYRFKCAFCEKATKIALKSGLNIDWGIILFVISGFYTIFAAINDLQSLFYVNYYVS